MSVAITDRRDRAAFDAAVLAYDQGHCGECDGTHDVKAVLVVPIEMGGSYQPGNGVSRCGHCRNHQP